MDTITAGFLIAGFLYFAIQAVSSAWALVASIRMARKMRGLVGEARKLAEDARGSLLVNAPPGPWTPRNPLGSSADDVVGNPFDPS